MSKWIDTGRIVLSQALADELASYCTPDADGCLIFERPSANRHIEVELTDGSRVIASVSRVAYMLAHPTEAIGEFEWVGHTCGKSSLLPNGSGTCLHPDHLQKNYRTPRVARFQKPRTLLATEPSARHARLNPAPRPADEYVNGIRLSTAEVQRRRMAARKEAGA